MWVLSIFRAIFNWFCWIYKLDFVWEFPICWKQFHRDVIEKGISMRKFKNEMLQCRSKTSLEKSSYIDHATRTGHSLCFNHTHAFEVAQKARSSLCEKILLLSKLTIILNMKIWLRLFFTTKKSHFLNAKAHFTLQFRQWLSNLCVCNFFVAAATIQNNLIFLACAYKQNCF